MMVAATLAEFGVPGVCVTAFDSNPRMGKKVAITGGGRCNVTTGIANKKELFAKYPRGSEFLEAAMGKFSPKKAREWFESNGCPIKMQDDLRAFPASDRGSDVVAVFERILRRAGTDLRLASKVRSVSRAGEGFEIETDAGTERFDAVILATGGAAYAKTGSEGGGYAFARSLGHSVTKLAPSLSAFIVREEWCSQLAGLALPNVAFKDSAGRTLGEGGMLFAHFGVTGPAVFALSARIAFETVSPESPFAVGLVLDAGKRFEDWDAALASAFARDGAKETKNALAAFFPSRVAELLPALAGFPSDRKAATVSKENRRTLAKLLSDGIPISLTGTRPGEEFVTAGGVDCREIDPETMESKFVPGLYFTGELLDVDAVTGGFNLQACWATGRTAGKAVA